MEIEPEDESGSGQAGPIVSVIVTTRNSARTLGRCLSSIRSQTYPGIELIVVDNSSSDATPAVAQEYCDIVATKGPERSAQRNYGAELSHGQIVVFIDSDMQLEPGVISEGVTALADDKVKAVVIPEQSFGEGFWTQCRILERQCYNGDDDVEAARMFRKDDFTEVGGYDENLNGAEDWDVSSRVAGDTALARTVSIIHHDEGRIGLKDSYIKRRYYADGYLLYLKKHKGGASSQWNSVLRPAFLRHWRDLLRQPVLAVGMFTLKFVEFVAVMQVAVEQWVLGKRTDRSKQVYSSQSAGPGDVGDAESNRLP